ncbi:MAG: FtsQ-type POTRA domain-containing protein [Candidatus Magasanikbacteria bacterium]|nr:FtsQ-type POTRA domain-containing protein [Candidatus Magasanikbacteria bacterium]
MYRRIINHHKIIKKVDRNLKKTHTWWNRIFNIGKSRSRDFAWEGRTTNPYKIGMVSFFRRPLVQMSLICLACLFTLILGIYSSFFKLDTITISGLQRIDESELRSAVAGILTFKKLNVIPQSSYFTAGVDDIRNILKERFPIEKIVVQKKFPDVLSIIIEEKISTIIYDSGEYYSYIDLSGKVVEVIRKVGEHEWNIKTSITTSTNEFGEIETHEEIIEKTHVPDIKSVIAQMGNYPLVYFKKDGDLQINDQILDAHEAKVLVDWFNLLTRTTDIPLKYFSIESDSSDSKEFLIKTYEAWYIKSQLAFSPQTQLEKIQALFREGDIDRAKLQYIDLRYIDRIFWK